jgi:uncharacterized protein (DUF362 family)/NAD-dependent dihydropyrimidine dehydrogenase PreA subunit
MKPAVSLQALADYCPAAVAPALDALLAPLGGMAAFVHPGQKVLLKPNMLAGRAPEKAVTTHPEILRAVIRAARAAGGIISVGDSPGVGAPEQVARRCGLLSVIEEEGARFAPFAESVRVRVGGGTFHELELARDILDADVVINLPKLKTHQMMGLTCGVKNLFGAVVGMRKVRLHLQAGTDKAFFALMLLELAEHIAPALTIVDAVVAMEGDGPGSGEPVPVGALLASASPLAVDTAAAALLGLPPTTNWTQKVAAEGGRPGTALEELELHGTPLQNLRVPHFRPAKTTDVNFGLPAFIKRPLKNALTARPAPDRLNCVRCGLCVEHCPPQAMRIAGDRLEIDYARCIRCFCCQELCPHGALLTEQGLLLRLNRFLGAKT